MHRDWETSSFLYAGARGKPLRRVPATRWRTCRWGKRHGPSASPKPFYNGFGVIGGHLRLRRSAARLCSPNQSTTKNSIMSEPLQLKDRQQNLLVQQANMPLGVMQAVLMHALQLRRSCREVFLVCDIQRHSVREPALILGISRAAATRRLQRARRRMDEAIGHLRGSLQEEASLKVR